MYEDLIQVTDTSILVPSDREVMRLHRALKSPAPLPTAAEWELYVLRAVRNHRNRKVEKSEFVPPPAPQEQSSPVALLEARIRTMPTAEVRRLATELGAQYEPHPTNPGLTAMRARNALYHAVRNGARF